MPWWALEPFAAELDEPIAAILRGRAAERALDAFLRAHRGFSREERSAASEALFGVGLWRRRLAWQLGHADPLEAAPRHLVVALLRDLAANLDAERIARVPPGSAPRREGAPDDLGTFYSLPPWLAGAIEREVGAGAAALADALCLPGPVFLRANLLLTSRDALAAALAREGVETAPGAHAAACLRVVSARPNLLGLAAARDGLFEVQDEGSQLLGAAAGARDGDAVLDACAGAGGKSLQLAAHVGSAGAVHACDVDAGRLVRLADRARRARCDGIVRVVGSRAPEELRVDRALVDAPCSELGPLRRGPDLRFRIDPATFAALPALQLALLSRAADHVRRGGTLAYATCTFRREENEDVAVAFEREHPGWTRVPAIEDARLVGDDGFLRAWPHVHGTDAVFAAAWRRG